MEGQEVRIMSLCGTKGAEWKLHWKVRENGDFRAGIGWKRTVTGAVKEWTSGRFEVNCAAISGKPLASFSLNSTSEELP